MQHADHIIERTLVLKGQPNLRSIGKLLVGEDVPECLKSDLRLKSAARTGLIAATARPKSGIGGVPASLVS